MLVLCTGLRRVGGREEVTRHGEGGEWESLTLPMTLSIACVAYSISVDRSMSPMGQEVFTLILQGENLKPREVR